MIGTRRRVAPVLAVLVLAAALGRGGPDPAAAIAGRSLVIERAAAADAALLDLQRAIEPALELARTGAARVVNGEALPGEPLARAGSMLVEADPVALRATRTVRALEGARRAVDAGGPELEPPTRAGELASIGTQLQETAAAADHFAAMRLRAERVLADLATVVAALDARQIDRAEAAVRSAREAHSAVAAWEIELATLPVWIEASGSLLDAADSLVAATAAGDAGAASRAAEDLAAQREGAASADRALRIAIGEGGAPVTAAPLGRLAALLRDIAEARIEVAGMLQSVDG